MKKLILILSLLSLSQIKTDAFDDAYAKITDIKSKITLAQYLYYEIYELQGLINRKPISKRLSLNTIDMSIPLSPLLDQKGNVYQIQSDQITVMSTALDQMGMSDRTTYDQIEAIRKVLNQIKNSADQITAMQKALDQIKQLRSTSKADQSLLDKLVEYYSKVYADFNKITIGPDAGKLLVNPDDLKTCVLYDGAPNTCKKVDAPK